MEKALDLKDFTILMIATLADNSRVINFINRDNKVAVIPVDYKQRIENILCAENGWKEEFSILINIDEYFEDHFTWEQQFAMQIKNVIEGLGKNFEYDFLSDSIKLSFTQKEVDFILSNYRDEKLKNIMKHFTSLLSDLIYSRKFQEEFHDYSSKSVQYMKNRK